MIPILGQFTPFRVNSDDFTALTHAWEFLLPPKQNKGINGNPSIRPHKGVGTDGLAIAMMVNEPSHTFPNCIFDRDCVITARGRHSSH